MPLSTIKVINYMFTTHKTKNARLTTKTMASMTTSTTLNVNTDN